MVIMRIYSDYNGLNTLFYIVCTVWLVCLFVWIISTMNYILKLKLRFDFFMTRFEVTFFVHLIQNWVHYLKTYLKHISVLQVLKTIRYLELKILYLIMIISNTLNTLLYSPTSIISDEWIELAIYVRSLIIFANVIYSSYSAKGTEVRN